MADRSTFFGETEIWEVHEPGPTPAPQSQALDPGVSAVLTALDGCSLDYQMDVLESTLAAIRAAFEVGLNLPSDTFLSLKMDTERN
jgi:hypothetical protein